MFQGSRVLHWQPVFSLCESQVDWRLDRVPFAWDVGFECYEVEGDDQVHSPDRGAEG